MEIEQLAIEGVLLLRPELREDSRGSFLKLFTKGPFVENGVSFSVSEVYYSHSHKDVLRGMHFQLPPHEHSKIVHCQSGSVLDVVLDLRTKSPTYGQAAGRVLTEEEPSALYIPAGCAHGFLSLTASATLLYLVSSDYHPQSDTGIHWDSFGFSWPCEHPIVSDRDRSFIRWNEWSSPF